MCVVSVCCECVCVHVMCKCVLLCHMTFSCFLLPRLTGYSPFQGDTHQETFLNVSTCDYNFDDEVFSNVSQEAREFIEELLVIAPK